MISKMDRIRWFAIWGIAAVCAASGHAADETVFEDTFDGPTGSAPDAARWTVQLNGGEAEMDGEGRLVLQGTGSWNQCVLESTFEIPGKGDATYEIEYDLILPEHAAHYVGINSLGGATGPSHHRAFMLQGDTPTFANPGGINLTTSISAKASGGLGSDLGVASDAPQYALNTPLTLVLRLNADGSTEWRAGESGATKPLRLTGGDETDLRALRSWTRGPGAAYRPIIQANGWPGERKQILVDRVAVRKVTDATNSGAGYLENVNIVLQYGDHQTGTTSGTTEGHAVKSYESPTGTGIWYAQKEIEPYVSTPYEGEYYEAKIPATLDLAERGALAVHAITSCADPASDYEIYGWLGNPKSGKATMKHTYHDYNGGQPKWMRQLALGRTMSGSKQNAEVDQKMLETMLRMTNDDGLYYIPVKGQSWEGKPDSVSPWTEPGVEQVFDVAPAGRAVLCLAVWYAREPENKVLKATIERMIDGLLKIAIKKDGACWIPRHFYDGAVPAYEDPATGGTAVTSQSTIMAGIARYYALTGYEPARQFCEMFAKYWLGPAHILNEAGEWQYGGDGTHYHGTTMALIGLLEWARASKDQELAKLIGRAYEFGRKVGDPITGWSPEGYPVYHPNTEPCGIGDMVVLGAMLSEMGIGDYWEDVEHYTRNMLAAAQITDSWFIEQVAAQHPGSEPMEEPYETDKDVARRMIGTFSGMSGMTGQFQTVSSHCCTGNGNQGFYFAWSRILSATDDALRVNLLMNRASQWADVDSFLPFQGRVDVRMKSERALSVRIPSWVEDQEAVTCTVDGAERAGTWDGRYLNVGKVKQGAVVSITFPQPDRNVTTTHTWITNGKRDGTTTQQTYTLRMRGFDVVDIWPRDPGVIFPFYVDEAAREDTVLWKSVTRFAPKVEGYF